MTAEEARAILEKAEYWHYAFKFPWGETVPGKQGWKERVELRRKHFFKPLLDRYKGFLNGKNILDLGCCQGYWSFAAEDAGAETCYGIDSCPAFIREAQAAATIFGKTRCTFQAGHLENSKFWDTLSQTYEITLLLGTLFHLTDPIYALRKAMLMTRETIVLDGEVAIGEEPAFYLRKRTPNQPTTIRSYMLSEIRTVGSVSAFVELLKDGGFKEVQILIPSVEMPADYRSGTTASIIASR